MATSLEISKKQVQIDHLHPKKLSFDVKIAKIGPADLQIICLREIIKKKKEITDGKIYSPSGKFAELAKKILMHTKTLSSRLPQTNRSPHANTLQLRAREEHLLNHSIIMTTHCGTLW